MPTDAEHAAVLRRLLEYYPNAEWVAAIERAIEKLTYVEPCLHCGFISVVIE